MSRDEGFDVMDVSTGIMNDPKVRKLLRLAPDRFAVGLTAYLATMAESWKAGRRISTEDAWPVGMPFDQLALEALQHVALIDRAGNIPVKTWRGWFEPARERRESAREKWRRANDRRKGKDEAIENHGTTCGLCQEPIDLRLRYPHPMSFTVDHIVALALGGSDEPENRQPAHLTCNLVKGHRTGYNGGTGVVTTATVPPVPPVRPSGSPEGERESVGTEPAREPERAPGPRLVDPSRRSA